MKRTPDISKNQQPSFTAYSFSDIQANLLIVRLLIVKLLIVTWYLLLLVTRFTSVYLSPFSYAALDITLS